MDDEWPPEPITRNLGLLLAGLDVVIRFVKTLAHLETQRKIVPNPPVVAAKRPPPYGQNGITRNYIKFYR